MSASPNPQEARRQRSRFRRLYACRGRPLFAAAGGDASVMAARPPISDRRRQRPISTADPAGVAQPPLLSFANLIEAHVLRSLRTEQGVTVKALRSALIYAEKDARH